MEKDKLFKQIVEEAKKEIIDPLVWLLYFESEITLGISHQEYVEAVAERYKYNSRVLKKLKPYLELWRS